MNQEPAEAEKSTKTQSCSMNDIEKRLLNQIQSDFPTVSKPFKILGAELDISEQEAIAFIKSLKERGIIRRIGAIFDSQKLEYKSTLCAMKVPPHRLDQVAELVSSYPEVTHNYGREHQFNLWFTLIAEDDKRLAEIIEDIKAKTEIDQILNLPAINLFKINVDFKF